MLSKRSKKQYLDIVDKNGKVIGKDTRENLHKSPGKIHPTVNILIQNSKSEILIHKRSKKKRFGPGIWEISAGGHVDSGESVEEAAQRELGEELGISVKLKFVAKKLFKFKYESELAHLFLGKHDGPFRIYKKEIEKVRFVPLKDLEEFLNGKNKEKSMLELWLPTVKRIL